MYAFREREYTLDLIEDYCGKASTQISVRIGGVPLDLPKDWIENLNKFINHLPIDIADYEGLLDQNRIWEDAT